MSMNDDDYLSDKFLVELDNSSSKPRTYSQIRKDAQKRSQLRNEQKRSKSRRQMELDSREAGLGKSLFERAKEEDASGIGSGNKALSIMMKMGFKPGQSLGKPNDQHNEEGSHSLHDGDGDGVVEIIDINKADKSPIVEEQIASNVQPTVHKTEPLPLQEWTGKKGIGHGKRAGSPSSAERMAKMAKMAEEVEHRGFRERTRDEYNNRRAEGRLGPAQVTCRTLDERMGKSFNVLWLNPGNDITFPCGLIEALTMHNKGTIPFNQDPTEAIQSRVRRQMQADALQPLRSEEEEEEEKSAGLSEPLVLVDQFGTELLEEATQFLRLQAQDRLELVLTYLRDKHGYCFWCGVEYDSSEDMESECPGREEEDHD